MADGEMEPVLSGAADTLESIQFECQLGTLLADDERSSE
jgi:hypothetical protein